ncbi:Uncharacterised protein [Metamycoplasma arthritidis]|uniref:Hypothetical membrane protein n=1 Tax=Metamycoplasma arthritidis (strain 158L3-1) TaxID=243272 RepID=B3PMY6_META1|nr:hypothetical protein [Metamycoplasma arthritidis]ACF07388.1 hypothetical membrane protein [Metamycoplasma arthritidis 158L3-1]VEU78909.1 Uncharacterised protein [Metamycoplasma arthritidis]
MNYFVIISMPFWVFASVELAIYLIFYLFIVYGFSKNYFKIRIRHDKKFLNVGLNLTILFLIATNVFFIFLFVFLIYQIIYKNELYIFVYLALDVVIETLINIILISGIYIIKKYKKDRFYYPRGGAFGSILIFLLSWRLFIWHKMTDHEEKIIRDQLKDKIEDIKTLDDLIGLLSIIEEREKKWDLKINRFWYDKVIYNVYGEKFEWTTIDNVFAALSKHQVDKNAKEN